MFKPMGKGATSDVTEVIPTGIEVLDKHVLGCGGWPARRIVEVFSDPSAGKTSLGFAGLASAQRGGGLAILIETEDALQVARATVFGVDLDEVFLSEPDSIEGVIEAMREGLSRIPSAVGPNLLVWDSLAMSSLDDLVKNGLQSKSVGKKAKIMSEQFPPIVKLCKQTRTCMMVINQARQKIGVMFGNPVTTPGGETHKFATSIRLQLWAGSVVKQGDKPIGVDTTIKAVKNKLAIPNQKAKVRLLYERGFDDHWTTLNFAKDLRVVDKSARLNEANYEQARAELGWEGPGTPFTAPPIDIQKGPGLVAEDDEEDL